MLEAVIFDMDGVLIDSEPLHYKSDLIMLERLNLHVESNYLNQFVGVSNTEMWRQICTDFGITADIAGILSEELAVKISLLENGEYEPINGVLPFIKTLRQSGLPIGVASSSQEEFIDAVLKKIGLSPFIDRFVSGESVPQGKPAPDIFLKTAQLLGAKAQNCLVIEDSTHGVTAAKSAGMKCIGYKNPNSGNQDISRADLIIEDFNTLTPEKIQLL